MKRFEIKDIPCSDWQNMQFGNFLVYDKKVIRENWTGKIIEIGNNKVRCLKDQTLGLYFKNINCDGIFKNNEIIKYKNNYAYVNEPTGNNKNISNWLFHGLNTKNVKVKFYVSFNKSKYFRVEDNSYSIRFFETDPNIINVNSFQTFKMRLNDKYKTELDYQEGYYKIVIEVIE